MNPKTVLGQEVLKQLKTNSLPPYGQIKLVQHYLIRAVKFGTADEVGDLFRIAESENIEIDPNNTVLSELPDDFDPHAPLEEIFAKHGHIILRNVPTGGDERLMQFSDPYGGPDPTRTLLHVAAQQKGDEAAKKIEVLLSHEADVHRIDRNLLSPLDYAAKIGNVDSVRVLIKADPQPREYKCHLPYIEAASSYEGESINILKILKMLEERGDDPNMVPNDDFSWRHKGSDENALMAAARAGYPDRVELILQNPKTDPNRKRLSDHHTALDLVFRHFDGSIFNPISERQAQQTQNQQIALLIIGHPKFAPHSGSHRKWLRPYLHTAILFGELGIIENLIKRGADVTEIWGDELQKRLNPLEIVELCLQSDNNTEAQQMTYLVIKQIILKSVKS